MNTKYELVRFIDNEVELDVNIDPLQETIWLTAIQIAELFDRDYKTIRKHINNVFQEELNKESNSQKMRLANSDKPVEYFNLDVIISVGYRVNSKRGVLFRKWANSVLRHICAYAHWIEIHS